MAASLTEINHSIGGRNVIDTPILFTSYSTGGVWWLCSGVTRSQRITGIEATSLPGGDTLNDAYFRQVRRDIDRLLPDSAQRILDVGAGVGATSAWLKSRYPGCTTIAFEGNSAIQDELAKNVDEAFILDLNGPLPDIGAPDLVLCLDVLEHLVQPLDVLRRVTSKMPDNGTVIVSLPNIAHASVSLPLLLQTRFRYRDTGILDRTHLRFFDRRSALELMNQAGFIVRGGIRIGFSGPRTRLIDIITVHGMRDHLTKGYVVAGTRVPSGRQGPVDWWIA
jgi:hypothetical protein